MKKWSLSFLLFFIIASTLLSWYHVIYTADVTCDFGDEIANDQAIVSFFSTGQYKNVLYGLTYSSGVIVTWPAAVGWFLNHNLLTVRLSSAFFSWIFALWLGFYFFRQEKCSRVDALTASVFLWAWTITTPFALPYWIGFLQNLGELNAVLLIGFALLLLSQRPFLGTFLLGAAVWHGKLIFLPFAAAILMGHLLSLRLSFRQLIKMLFLYFLVFLSPLLIWMLWLWLRFGASTLVTWAKGQWGWINFMTLLHRKVLLHSPSSGWERFSSQDFEWVRLSIGSKLKNLLFSLGAIGITLAGIWLGRKRIFSVSSREKWISLLLALMIGAHAVQYFFFHPTMWQRHFQPSLYIGFGLWIFWITKWIKSLSINIRPWLYIAAIFLLIIQAYQGSKHPLLEPLGSYSRSCIDLYGPSCNLR